jgi:hypothetical protein
MDYHDESTCSSEREPWSMQGVSVFLAAIGRPMNLFFASCLPTRKAVGVVDWACLGEPFCLTRKTLHVFRKTSRALKEATQGQESPSYSNRVANDGIY